jgi:flagellar basal-body rod protein FlgC
MGVLRALEIAGSALTAQRLRMDVTSSNIANAEATSTPGGGPYRRERVAFAPIRPEPSFGFRQAWTATTPSNVDGGGVQVQSIVRDDAPPRRVHDPGHPDADANGDVAYPNVDLVTEMTDMLAASRAYEASITVIGVAKSMAQRALDIGRL